VMQEQCYSELGWERQCVAVMYAGLRYYVIIVESKNCKLDALTSIHWTRDWIVYWGTGASWKGCAYFGGVYVNALIADC
jgi:hypothetical protein